jgi:DNA anti-recombination protein RmuC
MESSDVTEIKRHFNVVAEGLEKNLRLVAEGVSALDDRVGRVEDRMTSLEEKMERGFDEIKAMIKFSYAELDRRVTSLEAGLARLELRVQKIEAR